MNKRFEPVLSELWQSIEIGKLRFWSWCGCREPVPEIRLAMHAKRRADRVAVLALFKTILTREDLDAVFEAAAFDRNCQAAAPGCKCRCGTQTANSGVAPNIQR